MTQTKIADLIGLSEIADLYGVDTNTANGWRRRKDFPKPIHQLRMGPMWDKEQVLEWRWPTFDHEQLIHVTCAWCGSQKFDDVINFQNANSSERLLVCGDCDKSSRAVYVVSSFTGDHKNIGFSLKVVKKETK